MKEVEPSPHQNHLWPGDLDPIRGWKEEAAGRRQAAGPDYGINGDSGGVYARPFISPLVV